MDEKHVLFARILGRSVGLSFFWLADRQKAALSPVMRAKKRRNRRASVIRNEISSSDVEYDDFANSRES